MVVILSCFFSYSVFWIGINNEEVVKLIMSIFLVHSVLPVAIGSDGQNVVPKIGDCVKTGVAVCVEVKNLATFAVA